MAKYKIIPSTRTIVQSPISIGHKAEKGVEAIEFDLTAWVETYGSGTLTVIMRRWGDAIPYPIALEIDENNKATWTLSDTDTAKAGMAYAQLSYIVGDEVVKKSDIYTFRVMDSLTGEGEPPEAYDSWLEHLTHLAAEAMAEVLDIEGIVTDKTLTVDGGIADAKKTGDELSALKADLGAQVSDANQIREIINLFILDGETKDGLTLITNSDGTITINGTSTKNNRFGSIILPSGTYKCEISTVSGASTGAFGVRNTITGSNEAWRNNVEKTFETETEVYIQVNTGSYTNYTTSIVIYNVADKYTAVDGTARYKINNIYADVSTINGEITQLSENVINVISPKLDSTSEIKNFFILNDETKSGLTLITNSDGTITINGTSTINSRFGSIILSPGTYKCEISIVSGETTGAMLPRNTVEGGSEAWNNNVEKTFETETEVYIQVNTGSYTNYTFYVAIYSTADQYTAVDDTARYKISAINNKTTQLNNDVSELTEYKLPENILSKYNAFTCVDKTAVQLSQNTVLLAYGDSITRGADNPDYKSWVNILQEKYNFTLYKKAVSGATFGHDRESNYWISTQLENTTDAQFTEATLVVFAAGTNDAYYTNSYTDIKTYIQGAIDYVRTKNANVPILFITPIKRGTGAPSEVVDKIPYISGIIGNVALINGCSVICGWSFPIPSYDEGLIQGLMGTGHIHPGPLGQNIYAMSVLNAIL